MRRFLCLLLLAGAVLAQNAPESKVKKLTPDELKVVLEKKNVFFLDVREPKELVESGTIKGYVNIPVGQLERRLSEVPKDKTIVTACAHGVRATRAAEILLKNGFKIGGACGLADWKEKNYPLIYPKAEK